jgi:hypothetical protein
MTFPSDPAQRFPKGDHNRRLALGLEPEELAFHAGISVDELHQYEFTPPDGTFDPVVADRVGTALERLEAVVEPKVENGDVPVRRRA